MLSALKSSLLRRIVAAYTINRLGTWFGYVALSVTVFAHTHSALGVAALLVAGQALPAFLVPGLVARVESSSRRAPLSTLYGFQGVATVALAVLLWHFWLPAILLLVAADGTAGLAASALLRAEAARVARVEAERSSGTPEDGPLAERKANAALNAAFSLTFVLGPGLAGLVVARAGGPTALLIDAGTFFVGGAMMLDLQPHIEDVSTAGVRSRLRSAWAHIHDVAALRTLLIAEAIALIFFAADASIEVPYAKATLQVGDRGYGLLLTIWGIGAAVGSIAFARAVRRPVGVMLSLGTLAVGVAYVGFSVAPSLPLACVAGFIGGAGNGVQWASLISAVQQLTPSHLQGRMMGAVEGINALFPGLGLALGGLLVAVFSTRTAFLIVGLGAIAMTTAFVRLAAGPELKGARVSDSGAQADEQVGEVRAAALAERVAVERSEP
ncbi:MAG: MFS transporter [Solirubrobacteraceae bacterium]